MKQEPKPAWRVDRSHLPFALLIAGLASAPAWFGGNRMLAWGVNAVLFGAAACLFEASVLVRGEGHPVGLKALTPAWQLMLVAVAWGAFQAAALAPLAWIHPIWSIAREALSGAADGGGVSVNPDLTVLALMRLLTCVAAFWLALQLCRDARRARWLLQSVAAISTAYAGWGLIALTVSPGAVLGTDNPEMTGYVTSTFVNRNSFATYAGMGLTCAVGLMFHAYGREAAAGAGSLRLRAALWLEVTGGFGGALLIGEAVILTAALLLSVSRGGILSSLFGLGALGVLSYRGRMHSARRLWGSLAAAAAITAAAIVLFGEAIVGRVSQDGLYDGGRVAVYKIVVGAIAASPWLGHGYGTFADVFPMFRDRSIADAGVWDKAHNTYLEVLQGLGLVAGAMLIASVALLVMQCALGAMRRRRDASMPAVAAASGCIVGLHALVDFSLQIQAVALTFAALLGAGVAQSVSSRKSVAD